MADTKEAVSLRQLYQLGAAAKGRISRIYLHWTAGHYGQAFADYHLNIDSDGQQPQKSYLEAQHRQHRHRPLLRVQRILQRRRQS